nr:matrix remodeling-associated protein 8-like [Oncorhynchus nerka]
MGYFLATFFLLAFIITIVIVLTRRRRKRGLEYDLRRSERSHVTGHNDIALDTTELKVCTQEYPHSDSKNNLLKERDMFKGCNKEMDGKLWI